MSYPEAFNCISMGLIESKGFTMKYGSREINFSFVMEDRLMKASGGAEVKTHICLTWTPGEVAD